MTTVELARLVKDCRDAQQAYFAGRSSADLARSKALEARVDRAVRDVLGGTRGLFDPAPAGGEVKPWT